MMDLTRAVFDSQVLLESNTANGELRGPAIFRRQGGRIPPESNEEDPNSLITQKKPRLTALLCTDDRDRQL